MKLLIKAATVASMGSWLRAGPVRKSDGELAVLGIWQKVFVGLVAVAAVIVSMLSAPGLIGILAACFALVMLAIAITDWCSFIIPNWLNACGLCLAIMHAAVQEPAAILLAAASATMRGGALALVFLAIRYGYAQLRGRQGLGLGDVKLALVAGAWLEWPMIPVAIELAVFAALSAYALQQIASGRSISATSRMPFGLFFGPAIWISWVLETWWLATF
jgi:leader peptidase (prepilin peptidase) / N-methyltransferase